MANPWFRLYSEFSNDPKVQMMSEPMQRRLIMLFCERCQGETLHETERAFHWRISETELVETKAIFIAKGFMDECWNVINWAERQFLSDSSTDRVRKHRQGLKQDETLQKHPTSVTVTPPDTEADSDTESEAEQNTDIKSSSSTSIARSKSSVEEVVDAIYQAYPRKVGSGKAKPAISTALKKLGSTMAPRDAQVWLYRKVQTFARSPAGQAGALTPHPATWFNQARYHDDPAQWEIVSGGSNAQPINRAQQRTNGNLAALAAATASINGHVGNFGGSAAGTHQRADIAGVFQSVD